MPLGFSTVETPAIDALDHAIIAELRNDARVSWRELGERVGLGPTATADRVRRLEQLGVVGATTRTWTCRHSAWGSGRSPSCASLPTPPTSSSRRPCDRHPRSSSFHVTGSLDYVLMLACPDVATLDRLLSTWRIEGGALESSTRILLRYVDLYS